MVNIGYVAAPMSPEEQETQIGGMVDVETATAGLVRWVVGLDPYGFEDEGWAEREIARIDRAFARGAIGVKIVKNVGLTVTAKTGAYLMPDDPAFDPVLEHIARSGRTLYLHVCDPIESWRRPDPATPHFRPFQLEPTQDGFLMYPHPERPSYEAVVDARDRLLDRHPDLRIVGCHLALQAHDLVGLARRLDRFPNFVVDTSAAHHQLMHYQSSADLRDFFIEYSDRLLYGSDKGLHPSDDATDRARWLEEEYARDWKWLSTSGLVLVKAFRADGNRVLSWDKPIEGLALPEQVLRRLYYANARRWVPGI
jgi:predicted TIM-barrel fold metal-dependent hydrolase